MAFLIFRSSARTPEAMKKLLLLLLFCACIRPPSDNQQDHTSPFQAGTLRDNIAFILQAQKDMGYHMPDIVQPPASDQEIAAVESTLQMPLNPELKALYKTINGISQDNQTPVGLTGIIPNHNLLSLNDAVGYYQAMDWPGYCHLRVNVLGIKKEKIGAKLFPFLHDGSGNCYWVDLNEGTKDYGRLYWTNTFGEEDDYLFDSLSEIFEAIKRGYKRGIFSLDDDGHLDCNYEQWFVICHEVNPSIKYWKSLAN